ncbi:MAG: type III secretion protein, partial [Waddliaceae bacterium]
MVHDEKTLNRNQLPCLGGIPILGAAAKTRANTTQKRNLMIFIRPQIIDTEEEFSKLTRQQQEIMKQKDRMKKSWKYEVDEAMEFMNIKPPCCDECQ